MTKLNNLKSKFRTKFRKKPIKKNNKIISETQFEKDIRREREF